MDSLLYNINGNVFNDFGNIIPNEETVLKSVSVRNTAHFTQVAAVGKTKNYSRVERLHSFFN